MLGREERIEDYRTRLRHDMAVTLREHGWRNDHPMFDLLVEELVEDSMHHIEHLVIEVTT
jgi:hypothetical protein